jgi:hypothetical protein
MNLDPSFYNLNKRIKLQEIATNHIAIVKLVKSRIIRKDAVKISEMAKQIQSIDPKLKVSLISTDNICGKSINLLQEENIQIIYQKQ